MRGDGPESAAVEIGPGRIDDARMIVAATATSLRLRRAADGGRGLLATAL